MTAALFCVLCGQSGDFLLSLHFAKRNTLHFAKKKYDEDT